MLSKDTRVLGQRQSTIAIARRSALTLLPWVPVPTEQSKEDQMILAHIVGCITERNPKLKELYVFVMGYKPASPLPWMRHYLYHIGQPINLLSAPKGTLSMFSQADHYANILEKIIQNKGSQCLCSEDMQPHKRHMQNYLPTVISVLLKENSR